MAKHLNTINHTSMSKKQQFIDQGPTTLHNEATIMIITRLSKTDISLLRRNIKKLYETCFTTNLRNLSLSDYLAILISCEELNKPENDGTENNLEK